MKKSFILTIVALLLAVGGSAQDKKTWAFKEKGLSDETIANLNADANWKAEDSGTGWYDATKSVLAGQLMANDEPIKEMAGITIGTAGLSNSNNIILRTDRMRINRDKMTFDLPQLKNGQTITIVCQSANGTATNRGVKASYDYMQRIEGPEDNLILGTAGEVTNKWQVVTNSTEPVDIQFTMITGGIDFRLIMIDEGDVPVVTKVAYLYDGTDDVVFNYLNVRELTEVTPINVTTTAITAEGLRDYDVTVVSPSVSADNATVLKETLPWTPVLNLNGNMYTAWGYGEVAEDGAFVKIKSTKNALFNNVEYIADPDEGNVLVVSDTDAALAVSLGDYFAGDEILGTTLDGNNTFIHTHNIKHNGYIYIPGVTAYTDAALQAIGNAIDMLKDSKKEITPAATPVISQEFKNMQTIVTISAGLTQPKTQFYYTTNGSEPTVENGTLYTEPFIVNTASIVKAIAIAEGYTASAVASADVAIYSQPNAPVISWTEDGARTTIKITGEGYDDNVKIWYNFADELTTDTLKSTVYADSIPVVITMPQNVTAFAVANGIVWSEPTQQRVLVKNPRVVIDVAAHFSAPQWTGDNNPDGLKVDNGKGMFSWGASAATMYVGEGTPGVDPETGDEIIIYGDEDLRPYEIVYEPTAEPEWVLKSRGTCLIWQNTGAQTTNFGDDSNYNPMYSTDVDPLFPVTKYDIQFYKFQAGETPNASIETLMKYQAPLDVVVLANMAGGPLVAQVSEDGENWQTIGEIAKTGKSRMWNKSTVSYDGTNEVYVRITEEVASAGPKVFDIYIANAGEKSQELLDQLNAEYATGIKDVKQTMSVAAGIYNLNGVRQNSLKRGLNIVVTADGTVKKVIVK